MDLYDLSTPAGIAAATIALLEILKKITVTYELKQYSWYPASVNLSCAIIAFGLSLATISVLDVDFTSAIGNGLIGTLLAIGGYEPLVNIIRGLFIKNK